MVVKTVFAAVLITLTVLSLREFATYTLLPSGLTAMPKGPLPTVIVAVTVSAAVFITLTVLELPFVTYALLPSGVTDTPTAP